MLGSLAGAMRTSCQPCVVFCASQSVVAGHRSGRGETKTDLDDMHGERVKELVCDEHGEAVVAAGHLVEGVVPCE